MSLVGMLGKMAVGALVAKGIGGAMGGGASKQADANNRVDNSGGGLGGGLGGLLGGNSGGQGQGGGGIGDLLGGLLGGQGGGGGAGGLGGLLGGQGGGSGGGLGGLLESLGGGGGAAGQAGGQSGGLGDLLNSVLAGNQPATVEASPEQNQQAEIMLRGMLNAAKCDGELDDQERSKLMEHLGDVSPEEMEFVKRELAAPVDLQGFIKSVPRGMEQQVYLMSLMAINLDSKAEAEYLESLSNGLGISNDASNQIHAKLGVPTLFT